jgi:hypothetical protein
MPSLHAGCGATPRGCTLNLWCRICPIAWSVIRLSLCGNGSINLDILKVTGWVPSPPHCLPLVMSTVVPWDRWIVIVWVWTTFKLEYSGCTCVLSCSIWCYGGDLLCCYLMVSGDSVGSYLACLWCMLVVSVGLYSTQIYGVNHVFMPTISSLQEHMSDYT